jgi:hypothetical protein
MQVHASEMMCGRMLELTEPCWEPHSRVTLNRKRKWDWYCLVDNTGVCREFEIHVGESKIAWTSSYSSKDGHDSLKQVHASEMMCGRMLELLGLMKTGQKRTRWAVAFSEDAAYRGQFLPISSLGHLPSQKLFQSQIKQWIESKKFEAHEVSHCFTLQWRVL